MVTYLPEGSLSPQSPALALSVKMATAINKKKKVPILSRFGLFLVLIWFQNVKGRLFGIGGISCVIFRNWISVVWRENDKRNDVQGKHAFGVLCGGDIVDLCNHVFRKYIASLSIFFAIWSILWVLTWRNQVLEEVNLVLISIVCHAALFFSTQCWSCFRFRFLLQ